VSYTSIKSILSEGLDRLPLASAPAPPAAPEHEKLRGLAYG
jgi:hypothetical protein